MTISNEDKLKKLIAIAKANKSAIIHTDVSQNLNEATRFVLSFDIKDGKNKILAPLIYDSYHVWSLKPISKQSFFEQFSQLFISHIENNKTYYLLNYKQGELINAAQKTKLSYE